MDNVYIIITMLGGLALFLYGITLMGDGLKHLAGNKLEVLLYKLTNNPVKGVLLGAGVTAVIQSSSATSAMVVGIVNAGMMQFFQAVSVILGSIFGTSITGWVISLNELSGTGWASLLSSAVLSSIIGIIGIILRKFTKKTSTQHLGDIFLGFAVLMFGMSAMSNSVAPLRTNQAFISFLMTFENPVLGILAGILLSAVVQSSSVAVGILQSLSVTGVLTFSAAVPMILGIAIGCSFPVLLSAIGANKNGVRTAFSYLLLNFVGVIAFACCFYLGNMFIHFSFMNMSMDYVSIALLNTVVRFFITVVLVPFIKPLSKLTEKIINYKEEDPEDRGDVDRLEERLIQYPALAIEQCQMVVDSMASCTMQSINEALYVLADYNDEQFERVLRLEKLIDKYEDAIGTYIVKLSSKSLSEKQGESLNKFLHAITDFERMSDHARNIAESSKELHEKGIKFSKEASHELDVLGSAVYEIVSIAVNSFISNDLHLAYSLEPLEELIDDLCDEMKSHHIDRLQSGQCTLQQGFVFNDLITDFERISDHCSNVAIAIIELDKDSFDAHKYIESIREVKDESYERYAQDYKNRFKIQ